MFPSDSQREFAPRPGSAYVTDEIWRKAGKKKTVISVNYCQNLVFNPPPNHCIAYWSLPTCFSSFAEEAVNEVKRQAMDEVQKAVAEAEQKAFEMIAAERAKMEKTLAEAKRKAQEDAILVINEQEDSSEVSSREWSLWRQ